MVFIKVLLLQNDVIFAMTSQAVQILNMQNALELVILIDFRWFVAEMLKFDLPMFFQFLTIIRFKNSRNIK